MFLWKLTPKPSTIYAPKPHHPSSISSPSVPKFPHPPLPFTSIIKSMGTYRSPVGPST